VAGELSVLAAIFKSVPDAARNRRTWTDDELAMAVYQAQSWRGVLRNLGLYQNGPIHVVKREAQRLGLDASHFGSGVRWTDARLTAALDEAASWPQLLSALGMRPESRRSREKVKARAAQLGLALDHLARPSRTQTKLPEEVSVLAPDMAHLRDAAQSLVTAWFLVRGMWPAAPAEPRPYDLLLESPPSGVKRVQVKTSTCAESSGSWHVGIGRHVGGGDRHNQRRPYRADEVDLFAIFDGELMLYLIPRAAIAGRTGICLGPYRQFMVGSAASMFSGRPGGFEPRPGRPSHAARHAGSCGDLAILPPSANPSPDLQERGSQAGTGQGPSRPLQAAKVRPAERPGDASAPDPRWTEDELRIATKQATSWADLLRTFGYRPSSTAPRRALRREVERHRIDTSHFVGQRRWSDQALIEAAKTAETWAELLTGLGLSTANKSCDSVRAAAWRLGLELGNITLGPKTGRQTIGIDVSVRPALDHLRHAATSIAAAWFLLCGRPVSTPNEPAPYDLIVDMPDGLKRVQAKSATSRDARGNWIGRIGHRPDGSPKAADFIPYGPDEVELFFVVDGDLLLYLIPVDATAGKATLSLRTYRDFVVGDASSLLDSLDPTLGSGASPLRPAS